jgi:hypothetical protein
VPVGDYRKISSGDIAFGALAGTMATSARRSLAIKLTVVPPLSRLAAPETRAIYFQFAQIRRWVREALFAS